jgi:DNA-binding SARP family transcriptional activator
VQIVEFGEPHLIVEGEHATPRLSKGLTLLARLAAEPLHELPRRRVIHDLFESGSDESTVSYLRLAVRAARDVLAGAVEVVLDREQVRCVPPGSLASESGRFEALLAEADRMAGGGRFDALMHAIEIAGRGKYLDGDASPWATDRRAQLEELAEGALLDGSVIAYELGEYHRAEQLVRDGLARNRFRESGWRLLMRVAGATHDGDGVIDAYRGAEQALAEIGAKPSAATTTLLGELRR